MITTFRTVIHGRNIELPWDLGLPEGRIVEVTIKTCPDVESPPEPSLPWWVGRLEVNAAVDPGRFVIKGTHLRADALVELLESGKSDEELLRTHPELAADDLNAVREYAKLPIEMRRSFGSAAEEAEDLDRFLEWNRQQRKVMHREIVD
jgi:uncharacterized protein (DUF433 family)